MRLQHLLPVWPAARMGCQLLSNVFIAAQHFQQGMQLRLIPDPAIEFSCPSSYTAYCGARSSNRLFQRLLSAFCSSILILSLGIQHFTITDPAEKPGCDLSLLAGIACQQPLQPSRSSRSCRARRQQPVCFPYGPFDDRFNFSAKLLPISPSAFMSSRNFCSFPSPVQPGHWHIFVRLSVSRILSQPAHLLHDHITVVTTPPRIGTRQPLQHFGKK